MTVIKEIVPFNHGSNPPPTPDAKESLVMSEREASEHTKETEAPVKTVDYVEEARSKGWKPKEEFEGDPEDWAPAKAWLKTGEILDSLHTVKKQAKDNQEALTELARQNSEIERISYEKAYRDAEARQVRAAEVGDVAGVKEATQELMKIAPKANKVPVDPGEPVEVQDFKVKNAEWWFDDVTPEHVAMKTYSYSIAGDIAKKYPTLSNAKQIEMIQEGVKKAFPHKFGRASSSESSDVLPPSSSAPRRSSSVDSSKIPEHHKRIMGNLKRALGAKFDEKAYLSNCKLIGEIK